MVSRKRLTSKQNIENLLFNLMRKRDSSKTKTELKENNKKIHETFKILEEMQSEKILINNNDIKKSWKQCAIGDLRPTENCKVPYTTKVGYGYYNSEAGESTLNVVNNIEAGEIPCKLSEFQIPDPKPGKRKNCYYKIVAPKPVPIKPVPRPIEPSILNNYIELPYTKCNNVNIVKKLSNGSDCLKECDNMENCKAVQYNNSDNSCLLLSDNYNDINCETDNINTFYSKLPSKNIIPKSISIQERLLEQKRDTIVTRNRMLELSREKNVYKKKVMYTLLAVIILLLLVAIFIYSRL